MSEFSESYHLRSDDQNDGVALLERAGLKGFVFPASNGWVTVLAEGDIFTPNDRLISANTGTLLYFANAEDHGWLFSIYASSECVCHYECAWEDTIEADHSGLDLKAVTELLRPSVSLEETHQILHPSPTDFDRLFLQPPATSFAQSIGLEHYEWLSYAYMETDFESGELRSPDVITVAIEG